ncbi:RagB/SusD family nutrient uptake outer membrane protein [Hufsiella ginkgonis]|uniref:RagB/SusD family nutrient uptake outer membrane protein n=1 Tax=Hufsiella ginkgonis TaxID=2695274 RepID=A0A7K1Y117_9SPHI|nr:RagB/SusD family nutrient uptake outer membrane protein [Hufsiella ginkgonis]MXV16366.1 RagB/SusD family nutrient uptake outer membrane protein [Hufsiella ginkgonis]
MKKIYILTLAALLFSGSCKNDDKFLTIEPTTILSNDVVFSDPILVTAVLGNLYNRIVDFTGLDNDWRSFVDFSEAFPSENAQYGIVQRTGWAFSEWQTWDYTYIRELNLFIERVNAAAALTAADKKQFVAEARFLRAHYYFELVKRMGGVPIVTTTLEYDFSGSVANLQKPRNKESEVYDFVIAECEAIKGSLAATSNQKTRASAGAALAMECRAALYAASIAKYGVNTPTVTLAGNEVGIPSSMANAYYTTSLKAAREIISGSAGTYKLYQALPNLSDNFAQLFLDKSNGNQEVIFVEDFKVGSGRTHNFTVNDQPFSQSEEGQDAGRLNPSLNLVQAYEKLDNTFAPIATKDGSGAFVYYTDPLDAFAGRDARLAGTVLLPNTFFKSKKLDIWAGYQLANGTVLTSGNASDQKPLPGTTTPVQVVGDDGPVNGLEFRTQTGFYIRKYLDPTEGSGRRGRQSDVWFVRYRFGEVLLNAAEASMELGDYVAASAYINQVRSRAGLTTPITLTAANGFDRIVHERRVELVFEGHTLFDMKRWRLAHQVWDGTRIATVADLTSNLAAANKRNTNPWGLWPYKYYDPGNPNNGKWIFKETIPSNATGASRFQLGNYYSQITDAVLGANPKIIRQPNQ